MPRFTRMLAEGMKERGHEVSVWSPRPKAFKLAPTSGLKKYFGYIDQFYFFPKSVRKRLKALDDEVLFVFSDQALGPWVPLVENRINVIHCHDFLAQQSAKSEIPNQKTGILGSFYQYLIHKGYTRGSNFISVSQKTQNDLHRFLAKIPASSSVVYNGLNQAFAPGDKTRLLSKLHKLISLDLSEGFLLHVGGNQWYKNRIGVIEIYNAWRDLDSKSFPLLLIGHEPDELLKNAAKHSPYASSIYFWTTASDEAVKWSYACAQLLIYPSLAEGFGWPIAEAMASGCPVITTGEAPMTEVGGLAARYIPRRPDQQDRILKWAEESSKAITEILDLDASSRKQLIEQGIRNAKRFDTREALDQIENIYQTLVTNYKA
ncbi:glycosyltransferase involved in cell wall biosynthesis [Leeuwenhoekiella aestuarii]|nr:glycosyltransferase involved in cell wall biosynthesis [Leeuwenhoekiella aestuarii]